MKVTLNIDDFLLSKAARLTGIKEEAVLVKMGLETLIRKASSKKLAELGGSEKSLDSASRERCK